MISAKGMNPEWDAPMILSTKSCLSEGPSVHYTEFAKAFRNL
jgi:hypothetical protein